MRLPTDRVLNTSAKQSGVSLIEMIVFIVVVSIALGALVGVYRQAMVTNVDPIIRTRALESAQSLLDEILSLQYAQNSPIGGVPACSPCDDTPDSNMDDVDDYRGFTDYPFGATAGYKRDVRVTTASNIKVITVVVTTPTGERILLAAERANF